jgi:hypothetical protein
MPPVGIFWFITEPAFAAGNGKQEAQTDEVKHYKNPRKNIEIHLANLLSRGIIDDGDFTF